MKGTYHMNKITITVKKREIGKKRGRALTYIHTHTHTGRFIVVSLGPV